MTAAEKIDTYAKLQEEIGEHFDIGCEPLEIGSDIAWWYMDDKDEHTFIFGRGKLEDDLEKGMYYGGEVCNKFVVRKETHTLIYYDTGCGDSRYIVVANSGEVKDAKQREAVAYA